MRMLVSVCVYIYEDAMYSVCVYIYIYILRRNLHEQDVTKVNF